jgi:hypothetical protein
MAESPQAFDPYIDWLGIDPALVPPNHYDLLGVSLYEANVSLIASAADYRMKEIRTYQTGPRGVFTQQVLNEIMAARICLMDESAKTAYDLFLRTGIRPESERSAHRLKTAPPVQSAALPLESKEESRGFQISADPASKPEKKTKLSWRYIGVCAAGLLLAGFISQRFDRTGGGEVDDPSEQKNADEVVANAKKVKKIINIIEKKGILPAANNTFLLTAENGSLEGELLKMVPSSEGDLVTGFQKTTDQLSWQVWIAEPGYYEAVVSYHATSNEPYSRISIRTDEDFNKSIKMRSGNDLKEKFEEQFVLLFRNTGTHVIQFATESEPGDFQFISLLVRPNTR